MELTDAHEPLCFCGYKLRMEYISPVKFSAPYAPQDEVWFCPLCGKCFMKTWQADDIDYFTEKADYYAVLQELRPTLRFCFTCKGQRKNIHPIYLGRPVCPKCFFLNEWDDLYKRREIEKKFPSDTDVRDFMAAERALENWSYSEAFEKYAPFAEVGFSLAQYRLGEMYETGPVETRDFHLALEWYKKAAQKRFPQAFSRIGKLYSENHSVGINLIEAYKWLNLGAYFGDFACVSLRDNISAKMSLAEVLEAQEEASVALRKVWGQFDRRKKILDSLERVYGELEGTYRYAEIIDGRSLKTVLLEYKESEKHYRMLSEDRYAPAMARFGEKLATGDGLEKNSEEAVKMVVTAISRGWLPSVEFAWNQIGSDPDFKIDREWVKARFFDEINNCNARAMYIWGMINFRGNGIAVDLKEAHKWLNLAQYFGARIPRPSPMEMIEREIKFDQLLETLGQTQEWLNEKQKKVKAIAKDNKSLKERVLTGGEGRWFNIGELFESGREGFLRHIILAYGCFDLAMKSGNKAASTHLEFLSRILTSARTAAAVKITEEFVISGEIPS